MAPISIYIHIPFCVKKCNYCDFLSFACEEEGMRDYARSLVSEIRDYASRYRDDYEVVSVFFGGGTPSLLPADCLGDILNTLAREYHLAADCEITMEANPGTLTKERLAYMKMLGVNRLSLGLQSTIDAQLQELGRIHSYKDFLTNYEQALKLGYANINVDLMSAIPHQTMTSYLKSLKQVAMLRPTHISAYSLIIEEGTPFGEASAKGEYLHLPTEEEEREMYAATKELLGRYGYWRYEISNYAQEGYACRHNCVYWERGEYVGFGLGAASLLRPRDVLEVDGVKDVRLKNTTDFAAYCRMDCEKNHKWSKLAYRLRNDREGSERLRNDQEESDRLRNDQDRSAAFEEQERLSRNQVMEETMFLGLRMMKGVSANAFRLRFGRKLDGLYGSVIEKYKKQDLLSYEDGILRLTDRGIDVSNVILSDFLL